MYENSEPTTCFFPGIFSPPTKYDLRLAEWLSRKIHDVNEVIIVIGKDQPGSLPAKTKEKIWKSYLMDNTIAPVNIYTDEKYSPLMAIYKMHEGSSSDPFSIAVPSEVADDESFQNYFEAFPDYKIIITPNYDKEVPGKMVKAVEEGKFGEFCKYIPATLRPDVKKEIFEMLKPEDKNPVMTKEYWGGMMQEMYSKYDLINK